MGLLKELNEKILIADGAMGTLLYSHGVDSCFEELNLSNPKEVQRVHEAYVQAGAQVIQTNTYGANAIKLSRYGIEDQVEPINRAAVQLAKNVADDAFVLGTIGGIRGINKSIATLEEIKHSFLQQLKVLLDTEIDGLLLETFYDFDELTTVLNLARKETELPIITNVSLHEVGMLQGGICLQEAFEKLEELGADVVGLNCRLGPHHTIESLRGVELPQRAFLSAYPNASLPDYEEGKLVYATDDSYFERVALELREQGVRLMGGCCGTTPQHVAAMAKALAGAKPIKGKVVSIKKDTIDIKEAKIPSLPHLHDMVKQQKSVIVELDTPKHLDTEVFFQGVKALKQANIDAITMADNSLASPRISNAAMATMIKNDYHVRPLVHITCRDRNLIGLQSHLMGLHTLGINQILAVTGDPTKIGDFPGATSVYDLTSFELITFIKQLNEGISFSGKSLRQKTNFSVGSAFNPNVRHLDRAVARLEKKIEGGADYFISQPVFNPYQMEEVAGATKHIEHPIYLGLMPLTSDRNAEFLHNEVPGIKLSDEVRERMAACKGDPEASKREGLAIAKELIDVAYDLFNGIYLITPFMRYDLTVELANYIHAKQQDQPERKVFNG
ncbi:bifunctional homocysteine S-methyltransferase/methylenetetrahydrofolate reductase [Bacillaceae bacterium S4-13-58]